MKRVCCDLSTLRSRGERHQKAWVMLRKKLKREPVTVSGCAPSDDFRIVGGAGAEPELCKVRIGVSEVEAQVRERY